MESRKMSAAIEKDPKNERSTTHTGVRLTHTISLRHRCRSKNNLCFGIASANQPVELLPLKNTNRWTGGRTICRISKIARRVSIRAKIASGAVPCDNHPIRVNRLQTVGSEKCYKSINRSRVFFYW